MLSEAKHLDAEVRTQLRFFAPPRTFWPYQHRRLGGVLRSAQAKEVCQQDNEGAGLRSE